MQRLSSSPNTDVNFERINRLFLRLSVIYGHIWTSQFRQADYLNLAKKEWSETLKEIHEDALQKAINECRIRYEMPPTLPQFYQLCKGLQPRKSVKPFDFKNEKISSPEVAKEYMTKIKEALAKVKNRI